MAKEKPTTKTCKHCKTEIPYDAKVCPQCRKKQGGGCLPKIVIGLFVIFVILFIATSGSDDETSKTANDTSAETTENVKEEATAEDNVPTEYKSALKKANSYSDTMHMSKAAIYDQLVSEYGEQFSEEAAQYAMDNIEADWNANALAKAEDYSDTMHMSKAGIYDQLTSEHGEQFTEEEAQYAIDNIEADWNANALAKAKDYQETMDMSPAAIHDQLTSEHGEQFTEEEADYAIEHLE